MTLTPAPLAYEARYEHGEEDEVRTTAELIETLRKIAEKTYEDSGHAIRSVHAKTHGVLHGELRVLPGLPEELAQGLFASTATHPVLLRFSTSPGDIIDDRISTPRGMAIKVMATEGLRLPGSEADTTQDFLLVDGPAFPVPGARKFLGNLKLLAGTTDRAEGLKRVLSAVLQGTEKAIEAVGGKSATVIALGGHAETNPLGDTYYTQVPMLYGRYMAKVQIAPVAPQLLALKGAPVDLDDKPSGLGAAVHSHFASQGGEWELRVQLCTDIATMPIEDASVQWPETTSPYRPVARITVPPQDVATGDAARGVDDSTSFSPWHGLAAHRPLGSIMRVRKAAYEASVSFRAGRNGCPIHEPRGAADVKG